MLDFLLKKDAKNIDQSIVDSILGDILEGSRDIYSEEIVIHIIKAFCHNLLKQFGNDYEVEVLPQEQIDKIGKSKHTVGLVNDKKIYLERGTVLDILNGNTDIIDTIMHEKRHIKFGFLVDSNVISFETLQAIMDQVIVHAMRERYYDDNYWYLYEEVDARKDAAIETYRYVKKICPTKASEMFPKLVKTIQTCDHDFKELRRQVGDRMYDREELFDRIIRRKPSYITFHPLLVFYYRDDGSKVSIGDILIRQISSKCIKGDQKIISQVLALDQSVIRFRSGTRKNIENDIASLSRSDVIFACLHEDSLLETRERLLKSLTERLTIGEFGDNIIDLYDNVVNRISSLKIKFYHGTKTLKTASLRLYRFMASHEKTYKKK